MTKFWCAELVSVFHLIHIHALEIIHIHRLYMGFTECTCVSVNDLCVCVCTGVCVPPPSYCEPILSTRQKAHLDLVGWKVGLLHRALLVNWRLLPVSRATLLPLLLSVLPLPGYPHVLPASKCSAQQIFETLQVNHKTERHPPTPSPPPLQTQKEGVTKEMERDAHTNAAGTSGCFQNRLHRHQSSYC